MGADRICIVYLSRNSYLIFLMHLLHHIDFKIAAGVYLVEIARQYFTAAQLRIMGDIKPHFPPFNNLLFGEMLGQDSWICRLWKAGASDQNIMSVSF